MKEVYDRVRDLRRKMVQQEEKIGEMKKEWKEKEKIWAKRQSSGYWRIRNSRKEWRRG